MDKLVLNATRRTVTGKKVSALRREGKLPAIMYGSKIDSTPISLELQETTLALRGVSASSLIMIDLEGEEHATLIRDKQRDVIRGTLLHMDFQVVSLTEKTTAEVGIELVGESPALKDSNGILTNGITTVEVEGLPQDLPERITLDLSILENIGDGLYVRDITVENGFEILTDQDEMIVLVTTGTIISDEEEEEEEVLEVEGAEPEVIERGKKEEEEEE